VTTTRLLLKPPVRIRPGALLSRFERTVLGPRAEEELFRVAEVLSEGRVSGESFFGSTLVTIDLSRLGIGTEERARELFVAAEGSIRVRLRAMRLAQSDALRRLPDHAVGTAIVTTRMRLEQLRLLVDVDLELPCELPSSATVG
jgi:hypothetical protein